MIEPNIKYISNNLINEIEKKVMEEKEKEKNSECKSKDLEEIIGWLQDFISEESEKEEFRQQEIKKINYCSLEGTNFPDPRTVNYWEEKENRFLFILDSIEDDSLAIAKWILKWNNDDNIYNIPVENRKPIKIFINSPGGYLNVAFAICDAIKLSKTPVYGINMNECSSAAALIYAHCDKRFAYPHSYFLLHLGSGGTGGSFQQSKAQMRDWEMQIKQMKSMFVEQLELHNFDHFDDLIDEEWYLYTSDMAEEGHRASDYNLITCVCKNYEEII